MTLLTPSQKDRARGCFLGSLVGDAAGAVLEFYSHIPTQADIDHALTMPGGGCWNVGSGQVTDDSELAICLARGLIDAADSEAPSTSATLPSSYIAPWYGRWIQSPPFDIGITTRNALGCAAERSIAPAPQPDPSLAAHMAASAQKHNQASESNGSLMRCSPLAIWGLTLTDEELAQAAMDETALTHPHPNVRAATAAYVLCAAHLIRSGDAVTAIAAAEAWATAHAPPAVQTMLAESARPRTYTDCVEKMGWQRWAFVEAFRMVRRGAGYEAALREVLALGGDTDTNACIVGGLVGALQGAAGIPPALLGPVLARSLRASLPDPEAEASAANDSRTQRMDVAKGLGGPWRPAFLLTGDAEGVVDALVGIAERRPGN